MTEKKDPSALAGATGVDRDVAGHQPDLFTISPDTTPPAAMPAAEQSAHRVAPNGAASTPDDRADDAAEIARLAALPMLDYARQRKPSAKRLGCPAALLDRLVDAARSARSVPGAGDPGSEVPHGNAGRAGHALGAPAIAPWPEPVDGAVLLDELARTIRRHVVLDAAASDATALWIVHTHAIDAADISPRLAITSPEKRCGKTTLLNLLGALVAGPLKTANMTPATLFRAIEAMQPTLLIDEADTFLIGSDDMRGIINAGHSRVGATVLRMVPAADGWELRGFDVWGALAAAAIGNLHGTIEDRALKIALRRRRPDEPVERLRIDRLSRYAPLARQAARWADDHHVTLSAADPDVPAELHDRAADNWRPLLAIADAVGGEWPERARRAAVALTLANADETEAPGITLLGDLREIFAAERSGVLFTTEMLAALNGREDRPWAEFRRGQPITAVQMAELLKPYGIPRNNTVRRGTKTAKGYRAKDFADVWSRYPR